MKQVNIKKYIRLTLKTVMNCEGFKVGNWFGEVLNIVDRHYQPVNALEFE